MNLNLEIHLHYEGKKYVFRLRFSTVKKNLKKNHNLTESILKTRVDFIVDFRSSVGGKFRFLAAVWEMSPCSFPKSNKRREKKRVKSSLNVSFIHCLGKVWCLLTFIFLRPPITPRDKIVGWFGIIILEWYLSSIDQTNPA